VTSVSAKGISFSKEMRYWEGAHPHAALAEFDYYASRYKRRGKWWK